jgi:hypothetical protein
MSVGQARPVIERIMRVVHQRLQVLMSDVYPNSPVVEVIRPTRTLSYTPKPWQIILSLGEEEVDEALSKEGNPPAIAYDATINIYCHLMPSETDPTPIDEYHAVFYADVVEALTDSGNGGWWSFGALAINSRIGAREAIDSDGGMDGFNVPLHVCYRVSEWSPYQVRW